MDSKSKRMAATGLVLVASMAFGDVVVEDFAKGWAGRNKANGSWTADSDAYVCNPPGSTTCGTSTVKDPLLGEDLVKNSANVPTAYDDALPGIVSKIKVSKDVSPTQAWAYAGWVMDFKAPDTTGAGPEPWNQPQWERKNEIDVSGCTAVQVKIKFTPGKQLWIELYNPQQEKASPATPPPQYGWRRSTSGAEMQTFNLPLTGLGSPVQKWTGTATDPKIDLKHINRLKFLYEGQTGTAVVSPAPYDNLEHELAIGGVSLIGGADCKIDGISAGILPRGLDRSGLTVSSAAGALSFGNLVGLGDLRVTVRDLSGKVVARSVVNHARPSMRIEGFGNGVYAVQVSGAKLSRSFSITRLD